MASGTMDDFLRYVESNEELQAALVKLAAEHDFQFTEPEELEEGELEDVAGGTNVSKPRHDI